MAGDRCQSDAELGLRRLKDPHVVSFSPMHHWTDHTIRGHTQTCVVALMVAHLMRRQADQAGLHLSAPDAAQLGHTPTTHETPVHQAKRDTRSC